MIDVNCHKYVQSDFFARLTVKTGICHHITKITFINNTIMIVINKSMLLTCMCFKLYTNIAKTLQKKLNHQSF